jgi:sugar/nucleoside kinase (ribokinase family)
MIVGLGCVAHDTVLVTDTTWVAGKGRIVRRETRFGGNVRNSLATVAALDHPAGYLATLGTSSLANEAMADLIEHGIDTPFIERVEGADPVMSVLTITSDGERYIACVYDALANTPLPSTRTIDEALFAADVLLVDAPTAPPGSLDVVQRARAAGIPVVLDAERDPSEDVLALISSADHLVIPLGFGRELTSATDPIDVISKLWSPSRSAIVVTDGANGSYAAESLTSVSHTPAFDTPVVDTTGCGDAFHGAYAVALAKNDDLPSRVTLASAAAAVVAAREPGEARTPTISKIAQLVNDASSSNHRRYSMET